MASLVIPRRHELKYAIPEDRVAAIREAIRPWCTLDRHCAASAERSYVIQTLYLDTARRDLYRRSRDGRPNSAKVRVRTYGEDGRSPVFLEVKRKEHGLVVKTRARTDGGWAERLRAPTAAAGPEELAFRDAVARLALQPVLRMRYEREAWFSEVDEYARVTFDRRITCRPWSRWDLGGGTGPGLALDGAAELQGVARAVVLELKCTADVPRWMTALVGRLGLVRGGYSKYCTGVERLWGAFPPDGSAS